MRITVFANDKKIIVFCPPRKIGILYKRIIQGLKAYASANIEKSDFGLITFLTKQYFQKNGFKCKQLEKTNFKVDLYRDFNLKEGWTIYKGIKINRANGSQLFKIGKTTYVTKHYEECFEIIDRELKYHI